MREVILYLAIFSAAMGCTHEEPPPVVAPRPAPVVAPPPPRVKVQEAPVQALSLQMMAGNIEPLQGDDPTLPDQVVNAARGQVLEGSYKMCISSDGSVQSVTPVLSIDGADQCIVDTLKSWRFPRMPLAVCKMQTLRFEVP